MLSTNRGAARFCTELLVIVVQAIERKMWSRLKACPDCRLVFYDYTENASKV
jgi:predicted RNA-binding Zn ribbon-like protein